MAEVEALKTGVNAMDATVATAFAMAVSYPSCGNIYGNGFMRYHGAEGSITALDFRAVAPKAVSMKTISEYKAMSYTVYDKDTCRELGVNYWSPGLGTAMFIQIDWENHVFYGAADPRSGDPSAFSVESVTG